MPIEWERLPVKDSEGQWTHDDYGYKNPTLGFVVCVLKDLSNPSRGYLLFIQEGPDIRTGGKGRTFITPNAHMGTMHWHTAEAARNAGEEYIRKRTANIIVAGRYN